MAGGEHNPNWSEGEPMRLWKEPTLEPWEIHPALTAERLVAVGGIIRQTRDSAARGAKRALGDDAWVIGCTAYRRSVVALAKASAEEYRDWLSTTSVANHHIIKLKGIPIRHYRGVEDYPVPAKYCEAAPGEDDALGLAFVGRTVPVPGGHFRLEVSTTSKSFTDEVRFVVVDPEGGRHHEWAIPQYVARREGKHGAVDLGRAGERHQGLRIINSDDEE